MTKAMHHRTSLTLGPEGLARLRQSRVLLVGVGGVGSWCAEALVRSGIGPLTLVDSDLVCVTNINRQLQATAHNVGCAKVNELRHRLLTIDPDASIEAVFGVFDASTMSSFDLKSYDFVIDAIDSLTAKVLLITAACDAGTTLYSSMGAACRVDPSRVRAASIWQTSNCPLARNVRQRLRQQGFAGDFTCVFSDEPPLPNHPSAIACGSGDCVCPKRRKDGPGDEAAHEWCSQKAQINGSLVHLTATFGMHLAGLVVRACLRQGTDQDSTPTR